MARGGLTFPIEAGPTHPYIGASPACWALFGESSPSLPPAKRGRREANVIAPMKGGRVEMADETTQDVAALERKPVYSSDGTSVGEVATVFLDKDTQRPEWLGLRRGVLGGKHVLVPVAEASVRGDRIVVPYTGSQIEGAPAVSGDEVSQETERELASHYGVAYSKERSKTGLAEGRRERRTPRTSRRRSSRDRGDEPTRDELYAEAKRLGIEGRSKMNKRELARAVERRRGSSGGRSSGRGRSRTAKANPVEVQTFLEGVNYPTRKGDLVREAERQGASERVRATLGRIRDEKFDSPADVSEAIGRLS
jgi:sporulation protein YlmC with PRC-barrel domain